MKLGYPCINWTLECKGNRTFRLKNYSKTRVKETVENNLNCLLKILKFNIKKKILFFRITSELVPFASHSIMDFNWQEHFNEKFQEIGSFITNNDIRISMHPGQYTVLNSNNPEVYEKSVKELEYHIEVLDLMELDATAKVQIHVGGVYNKKNKSIERFIQRYLHLDNKIINRLIIENDDKSYNLKDCLKINEKTNIPIVFDIYHHNCYSSGESLEEALKISNNTWKKHDGLPIIHYSTQKIGGKKGNHAQTIDLEHFRKFINMTKKYDFDIMLEIKDKENSALKAIEIIAKDPRFISCP